MGKRFWLVVLLWLNCAATRLQPNDHVLICGDSITEACGYSVFVEDYLLMCQPVPVRVTQCGEGGETAWSFFAKADALADLKPTVAVTCFGMNDGWYMRYLPLTGDNFRQSQEAVLRKLRGAGVRMVVAGTAGGVDSYHYSGFDGVGGAAYNDTLARLRDVVARLAGDDDALVAADVVSPMLTAMAAAKRHHGDVYAVAGRDGIHPGPNGHVVMAYAFLRALGCDGDIGTLRIDLAGRFAEASEGHRVLPPETARAGKPTADASADHAAGPAFHFESTRYPFCFPADAGDESARGIRPFVPFDEHLNRLTLVVTNAPSQRLRVTWGGRTRDFTRGQLLRGVNLAAEFPDNPFSEAFRAVHEHVRTKQLYDLAMLGAWLSLEQTRRESPVAAEVVRRARAALERRSEELRRRCTEARTPVRHFIRVEPLPDAAAAAGEP